MTTITTAIRRCVYYILSVKGIRDTKSAIDLRMNGYLGNVRSLIKTTIRATTKTEDAG